MTKRRRKTNVENAICVMLLLALLGFVISIQVKSVAMDQKEIKSKKQEQIASYEEQIMQLEKELEENKARHALLTDKYTAQIKDLYENNSQFYELYKMYESSIDEFKFYAGLTTVSGPGIDIGLDDAQRKYTSTQIFIVHDIYINEIINIL